MKPDDLIFIVPLGLLLVVIYVGSGEVRKFRKLTGERHWITGILGLTWFFRE